jgi:acyl-CoA synthetase (NDP forming)
VVSNAGFESVAMADNIGDLELATFGKDTMTQLHEIFVDARLDRVVDIHNPLDLTPMMGEANYEAALRSAIGDDGVDVGVFGCVPLTPALNTLAAGEGHDEDMSKDGSFANRIVTLFESHAKAFIAVVDGGTVYDPLATRMLENGVPTFRTADRALRALRTYLTARLR